MPDLPAAVGRDGLTGRDRRALVGVAIQFFVNGALWASVAARLPEVRDRTGVTVAGLGVVLTIGGAIGLLGSALAGRIVERSGTRRVLIVGNAAMFAGALGVAAARNPTVLVVGVGLLAFADVLVDISMNLQGSWISARRRVPVMNRLHGLWSLGTVGGGLGAAAVAALGWSLPAHVAVVVAAGLAMVFVTAARLLRVDEDHEPAAASAAAPSSWRPMVLLALAGAFALVMEQTTSDWAAFRLADDFDASAAVASLAYVAFTLGMTAGRFGGDSAQSRLGRDGLHRVALGVAVVGLLAASLAPVSGVVLIGYLLAGTGIATFFPMIYDDAARVPGRRGAGLGAMTAGSRLAGFVAPSIVGALAATSLSVGDAVALVTLPCAAGFALVSARLRAR